MNIKLSLIMLSLIGAVVVLGCRGKNGDRGPLGPGSTITTYTGTISSTYETVSAPALVQDSMVDVRVSSETNKWIWTDYHTLDYSAKTVGFDTNLPGIIGGTYKVLVQNPS